MREGGCFCGAVRYQAQGEPRALAHCHCLDCRRSSGALFVTWAEYRDEDFRFTAGVPARRVHPPEVERTFCPACGTTLTFRRKPGQVDITVASMDTLEGLPQEQFHLWTVRKPAWLELGGDSPRYPRNRPGAGEGPPVLPSEP